MLVLAPASEADAPLLTQMIRDGKAHWGYPVEWLTAWKDGLAISSEQIRLWHVRTAACDGKVIGFFTLAPHDGEWWLEHMWLVVERIGHGFGRELFQHAVAAAAELRITRLRIEAEPNAEGFYLRMGASRDGERVWTSSVTGTERVFPRLVYHIRATAGMDRTRIRLTSSQESATRRVVGLLEQAGACYQFTGGFAGNLHGSLWPLHDLDIDVASKDVPRVADLLRPYTTWPLGLYVDEEFELQMVRAEIEGQAIDVSQAEEAFARVGGRRVSLDTNLALRQRVRILDLAVWVQPLDELIAYKELLGRSADLADLRALQAQRTGRTDG